MVRLAVIEVDTAQRDRYNSLLKEEIDASIKNEPGVITLYGVAEKKNPGRVTLFETYADSSAYKSHLATPHFQKYKQGTLQMVKQLELIEMQPVLYHRNPNLSNGQEARLYIRLIRMEIEYSSIADFNKLAKEVMLPGIRNEPGVLVMYALAKVNNPSQISILEVYANEDAYKHHIETTHFLKYKESSKKMVKSLQMIDVDAILLGAKAQ